MEEKWAKVKGYENYEVSNLGGFRRTDKTGDKIILKGYKMKCGFIEVSVFGGHVGNKRVFLLHRLVAEYFLPNPEGYWTVKHISDNISDNRVSNLRWTGKPSIIRNREKIKMIER